MSWTKKNYRPALEMWGGVECSVVRTPSGRYDQLDRSGHSGRLDDLDRFAALGLRTLRYPLLWERHDSDPVDWGWADERMKRLRDLGITPIVGLLHHGCGPLRGGFLDPDFVAGFAKFARAVAERYPWIDAYTPINEPLTTARFSGLYGIWHPFASDAATFAKIFLTQCQAIRAAMAAIREINPRAQLVQTEDVGKTHSTAALVDQADWENERRWLTFDFLGGKLDASYPLWHYLREASITEDELASFRTEPCVPDILGMNHYVTGERWLDEVTENYPLEEYGGNGVQRYVDVPAVRARMEGVEGPTVLLKELWDRFRRPIAITEVQLACTREEQLRWLAEIWRGAQVAREQGVDVRAVTAWALVGAYDWNSLLLSDGGRYESGAFDVTAPEPQKTAIGSAIRALVADGNFYHPVLDVPGWWRRSGRLLFPPATARDPHEFSAPGISPAMFRRPLLLLGPYEGLSRTTANLADDRGLETVRVHHSVINDYAACCGLLNQHLPWGVVVIRPAIVGTHDEKMRGWSTWYERCLEAFDGLCRRRHIACVSIAIDGTAAEAPMLTDEFDWIPPLHRLLDRVIDQSFAFDQPGFEFPLEAIVGK